MAQNNRPNHARVAESGSDMNDRRQIQNGRAMWLSALYSSLVAPCAVTALRSDWVRLKARVLSIPSNQYLNTLVLYWSNAVTPLRQLRPVKVGSELARSYDRWDRHSTASPFLSRHKWRARSQASNCHVSDGAFYPALYRTHAVQPQTHIFPAPRRSCEQAICASRELIER